MPIDTLIEESETDAIPSDLSFFTCTIVAQWLSDQQCCITTRRFGVLLVSVLSEYRLLARVIISPLNQPAQKVKIATVCYTDSQPDGLTDHLHV